ncbi:MAG TPA: glutathione S-transferase N-terminal domain-containing protein [Stellaceae bacterium]|nr:glutathione S-transferase N-terminal domain-containing protein [Stellaceae bacterium]
METPKLILYLTPGASSMAPHIALHEVGAAFEPRVLSLARRENRMPDYLAINPEGKVPTLLIDGRPLTEVAAILYYLAKRFPAAGLWPEEEGFAREAEAIAWMSFIAATIHPARRQGDAHWDEVFRIADRRLGDRDWAVGRYSVADIHLFRLYWRFVHTRHPDPAAYPSLAAHYDRMMARPAVRRTCAAEAAMGYDLPGLDLSR